MGFTVSVSVELMSPCGTEIEFGDKPKEKSGAGGGGGPVVDEPPPQLAHIHANGRKNSTGTP
jgi:hypothetical protein